MGDKNGFRCADLILGSRDRIATTERFVARQSQLLGFAQNQPRQLYLRLVSNLALDHAIAKPSVQRSATRSK
jgi:hypothetical protein